MTRLLTERIIKKAKNERLPKDILDFVFVSDNTLREKVDLVDSLIGRYTGYVKETIIRLAYESGAKRIRFQGAYSLTHIKDFKKKVYDTEWASATGRREFDKESNLTLSEARELVDKVLKSNLWKQARKHAPKGGMKRQSAVIVDINNIYIDPPV